MPILDKIKETFSSSSKTSSSTTTSTTAAPDATQSLGVKGQPDQSATTAHAAATEDKLPDLPDHEVFDHDKVTVIFVLGGPGAGELSLLLGYSGADR